MRRLKEDPEVLVLALVLAVFAGCLLSIHPKRDVIAAARRATLVRNVERERWLQEHPIWRGLRLGLPCDGAVTNLAWVEHPFLQEGVEFAPGRFGEGLRCGAGRRVVAGDFLIRPQATWAMWARVDTNLSEESVMRLMDCNGVTIGIDGGRLRAGVFDGQWKEVSVEAPAMGMWFHVALTWRGGAADGQVAMYVNGKPARSRVYSGRIAYPYRALVVGAANDYTRAFVGVIDDACVFDRALADEEVEALAWVGLERLRAMPARDITPEFVAAQRAAGGDSAPRIRGDALAVEPVAKAVYRDIVLGLPFDHGVAGGLENPYFEAKGVDLTAPGQSGSGGRFHGQASITVPDLAITREGTWAFWMRLAGDAHRASAMRIMDVNGTGIQVEGQELTAFLYEEAGTHYVATRVTAGAWFHVAMTWGMDGDGKGSLRLYKDGVLQRSADYGGKPGFPVSTLKIGCSWDSIRFFHGDLDDLGIFKRRLDVPELRELMNRGLADWDDRKGRGE